MTQQQRSVALTVLSFIIIIINLLLEYYKPGVYLGVGYIFAVALAVFSRSKLNAVLIASASAVAVLFSVFFLHPAADFINVTANHGISLLGVVLTMFFVLSIKELRLKADKYNAQVDSIFLHATEGIIIANRKGEIVLANPCAENMFGYNKNELLGNKIESLLPDTIRKKHVGHREHFNEQPSNRAMGVGRDLFAMRKDGKVFPVEISLSHYTIGTDAYVTAFIIDITVRKKHDEALKNMNAELENKIQERTTVLRETMSQLERSKDELAITLEKEKELGDLKSRFVSTVSHEFRTPLSTILTSAQLAKSYDSPEVKEKRDKHLDRIYNSVLHMNVMLEDLLSLGKLEEGLVETKADAFNLTQFMNEFINEMHEINKRGQKIEFTNNAVDEVITDERLLKNILSNLVSNASKFSPDGSVIEINSTNSNGNLVISVSDKGMGISVEDQEHLFERFFRAKNATNVQGTGLGLHIVSKYIELLQGNITLASKLNKGTTFTISIPTNT